MKKAIITILATMAACWLLVTFVGAARMTSTAVTVPATEHTHSFPITYTVVAALVVGFVFWRWAKNK